MLDIKLIREKPDFVRQRLATRGAGDEARIDELLKLDEQRRKILAEVETLKAQRNRVSKEIGALMGQKKIAEAEAKKAETRELGRPNRRARQAGGGSGGGARCADAATAEPAARIGQGRQNARRTIRSSGFMVRSRLSPSSRNRTSNFANRSSWWISRAAAKLSGSGFILYTNWGARLERALIQFLLDLHTREHGYTEVSPPFMVGPQCLEGVGQFPKFKDQYYGVAEGDDQEKLGKLYLVPTAETPVANIHREEILAEKQLPVYYCAYTPCFRGEAGAAGVGTRGMIRVHQFDKVELIKIVKPEHGYDELEKMVANAEKVLQLLGLHYRVVLLCTGDMGFRAARRLTTSKSGRRGRGAISKFRAARIARISRRAG